MDRLARLIEIVGNRVSASPSELYCYSMDVSQARGMPEYVVRPVSAAEVSEIVRLANELVIPVTARGAGTGMAGGAVPVRGGIVLDMSSMNRIIEIDIDDLQVIVEPGVVHERLNEALKPHGFFFPPDPGSSAMCTIGGIISNNASGMRSVKYGTTRAYVLDLEVVLSDGRVIRTGSRMLKSAAGYDLTRLFVGSEGTLGIITRAGLKIAPLPEARRLVLAAFESAEEAGRAVVRTFSSGLIPSACEILDKRTVQVLLRVDPSLVLPEGDLILFELDGSENAAAEAAEKVAQICRPLAESIMLASSPEEMEQIWAARRLVGAAVSRLDPTKTRVYVGEDAGVPISKIPEFIRRIEEISERTAIPVMKYGHIGDGNLHVAMFIDVLDEGQSRRLTEAADQVHRTAIELGGTVSCEHGIGLARAGYMESQCGGSLEVMRSVKRAIDPKGIMNPGKLGL